MFPPGLTQASLEGVFIQSIAEVIGNYEDFLVPGSRWNDLVKELGIQSDEESQPSVIADPTAANSTDMDTIQEGQPSIVGDANPTDADPSPKAISNNSSIQPNPIPADTVSAAATIDPSKNIVLPGSTSPLTPCTSQFATPVSRSLSLPLAITPPPVYRNTTGKSIHLLRAAGFISPKIMLRIKRKACNEDDEYVPVATDPLENDNQKSSGLPPAPKKRRRRVVSSRTVADSEDDVHSRLQTRRDQHNHSEEELEPAAVPCERCDLNGDDCWLFP